MTKPILISLFIILAPVLVNAQLPPGPIARYQLDNTAVDNGPNGYNGTLTSTAFATDRFGTANAATAFTAGSSTGQLPIGLITAMQNNFSLGFWFNTTMNANSGAQWYNGNSLVDAEVCGNTNDYGVALINGGQVAFGIGLNDITIMSPVTNYNNGIWHFVTATRDQSAGTIVLYIDGVQVATASGTNTGGLTAPPYLGLAKNPCANSPVYTGSLDDIIVYNRVLNNTEVLNLYNYMSDITLPLHWLSFTGQMQENNAHLKWVVDASFNNDHFNVEHSADGTHFSTVGTVRNSDGVKTSSGGLLYNYSDQHIAKGLHYYRIRQVDMDGKYTLSKTVQLKSANDNPGFYLQSNVIADELLLKNDALIKIRQIIIVDAWGRIVISRQFQLANSIVAIGVATLKQGYYFIKISSDNGVVTLPWVKL